MATKDDIGDAYNTIHNAINAALAKTSGSNAVMNLVAESNAARSAYTSAMNASLNASDPVLQNLTDQLKQAAKDLAETNQDIQDEQKYIGYIGSAVGFLAKIAALVG